MLRLLLVLVPAAAAVAQVQLRPSRNTTIPQFTVGYDFTVGDVDGDGDLDVVVGNDHDPNQLLLNDGRGAFDDATAGRLTSPGFAGNATYEVDLADIDGDGDLDLLLCNDHDLPDRVHVNDGQGFFTDVSATALPPNNTWTVDQVVADFDGDGDVDWFLVDVFTPCRLYLNNGQGVFADASANLPPFISGTEGSFAVDLDGDSDQDIVLPGARALLNQGNAVFTFAPATFLPIPLWTGFAADVDGDGLADLVVNGRILLRNAGGTFVNVTATALAGASVNALSAALDADSDGDLDLVGGFDTLWVNDGTGIFTPRVGAAQGIGQPIVGDFDGDGDPDLLGTSTWTVPRLVTNLLLQVETPTAPRTGQSYAIDVHTRPGTASTLVVPMAALAGASTSFGALGTLRLDLAVGFVGGAFVQTGTPLRTTWTIPANAAFVGVEIHHQAFVVDPVVGLHLTNAVRDVVQ
jgi:hypothetical protein